MRLQWRNSSRLFRRKHLLLFLLFLLALAAVPGGAHANHGPLKVSLVRDINPGMDSAFTSSPYYDPNPFVDLNGTLLFAATNPTNGYELWRSDGTTSGTQLVKNINPGSASGVTGPIAIFNSLAYFRGCDATDGCELWQSDGTTNGTTRVTSFGADLPAVQLIPSGDRLFMADLRDTQIWVSDGTAAGTTRLAFLDEQIPYGISQPTAFNGRLAFYSWDFYENEELFVTDGTDSGTEVIFARDIPWFDTSYEMTPINHLVEFDDQLFFVALERGPRNPDIQEIGELWKSDGTAAGTSKVADLGGGYVQILDTLPILKDNLIFFEFSWQLWRSDGTTAGTYEVIPDSAADPIRKVSYVTLFEDELYFEATTNQYGSDLWKSDGTAAGTVIVRNLDLRLNTGDFQEPYPTIQSLIPFHGELYFQATFEIDAFNAKTEQWKTDGTAVGTVRTTVFEPAGGELLNPNTALAVGGTLFFLGDNEQTGSELFKLAVSDAPAPSGPVALYTFEEGSGRTVQDVSGVGSPLNLQLSRTSGFTWTAGGLRLNGGTALFSSGPASKIIDAAKESDEVTIEAWITPRNVTQYAARIATISGSATRRNLSLIQGVYDTRQKSVASARIRTNPSIRDGGRALLSPNNTLTPRLIHLVFSRSADGTTRMYVDGVQVATGSRTGSQSSWDASYRLGLGGEIGGGNTWRGTYHLLAFYSRALSTAEVEQSFQLGPNRP